MGSYPPALVSSIQLRKSNPAVPSSALLCTSQKEAADSDDHESNQRTIPGTAGRWGGILWGCSPNGLMLMDGRMMNDHFFFFQAECIK